MKNPGSLHRSQETINSEEDCLSGYEPVTPPPKFDQGRIESLFLTPVRNHYLVTKETLIKREMERVRLYGGEINPKIYQLDRKYFLIRDKDDVCVDLLEDDEVSDFTGRYVCSDFDCPSSAQRRMEQQEEETRRLAELMPSDPEKLHQLKEVIKNMRLFDESTSWILEVIPALGY